MLSLLLLSSLALPAKADPSSYNIGFEGSVEYLSTGEQGKVVVHVLSGPSGNYSWVAAASDGTISPTVGSGDSENFTIAVTAPSTVEDITVSVTLTNGTVNTTARHTIHVVEPVVITAQVKNSGNATVTNMPVQFKGDGKVLNVTSFTIPANSTKTLTYNWTAGKLGDGAHTVEVILDPDNQYNQYVRFVDGSRTYTSTFYIGDAGWGFANILLSIVFALLLLVLFFTYMNRGRKKRT